MSSGTPKANKKVQNKSTSISIVGDTSGNIIVGDSNVIGYTPEKVAELLKQINKTFQPKPFDGRCPYKGLDVFEEEDADLFFGREKLVKELVGRVNESRTVFITGPSGSGKSSLVRAGLLHALKQGGIKNSDRWLYETIKPGRDPLEALAFAFSRLKSPELGKYFSQNANQPNVIDECVESALSERKDQRLVLFIDQFEEIFTQVNKEVRENFIQLITNAVTKQNGRVIILFCMRSDFIPNCATYPELNTLLNHQFIQIGAMQADELVSAIAQPALRVGLRIDPDLIAQIINDMKGEPGALPLMQFALKDLFDDGQSKSGVIALTLDAYLKHGGIQKSLERHADTAFGKLEKHEQELARNIFSGLIEIGRGTQDTRRTALFEELIPANINENEVEAIIQKLADARLVTTDEQAGKDTVTISHEKLIDAWPWLKKLVNENREVIALQNEINSDAKEWEEHKRDASYLYTGARLLNADEQVKKQNLNLNQLAREFVKSSQTRKRRSQGFVFSGISIVVIVSILASILFRNQAQESEELAKISLARQLSSQSETLLLIESDSNIELAVLLAIYSVELYPTVEGTEILQQETAMRFSTTIQHKYPVLTLTFSPNSSYLASGEGAQYEMGNVHIWKTLTGTEVASLEFDYPITSIFFSSNDEYMLSFDNSFLEERREGGNFQAKIFDITNKQESFIKINQLVPIISTLSNNTVITAICNKLGNFECNTNISIWDIKTGKEINNIFYNGEINFISYTSDGKYLILSGCKPAEDLNYCSQSILKVWDINKNIEVKQIIYDDITQITTSPDRRYIVIYSYETQKLSVLDTSNWNETTYPFSGGLSKMTVSLNSKYLALGTYNGDIYIWDITNGSEVSNMKHLTSITSLAFSPDNKYLASGSNDGFARVWEIVAGNEIAFMHHDSTVMSIAFSPDGKYIASGSLDGIARMWIWRPDYLISTACSSIKRNLTRAEWIQYIGDALPYPTKQEDAACPNLPIEAEPTTTP